MKGRSVLLYLVGGNLNGSHSISFCLSKSRYRRPSSVLLMASLSPANLSLFLLFVVEDLPQAALVKL